MGKVKGKHRLDKYYKLAKEHGYRSRASWKLAQLDTKHQFLHSAHAVLDLCAAPGGWMQVAVQRVPVGSLVVGVDLVPIAPVRGAFSIQQDITKPECTARLRKLIKENGCSAFDLVLHDGSPNVGGAWSSEVKLATQLLAPEGTFITKNFPNLKYIDLSSSQKLISTPDFTGLRNLEELFLMWCTKLVEVHPSIAVLKRLKVLKLCGCKSIKSLPSELEMDSLERLSLVQCSKVKKIPEFSKQMKNLSEVLLGGTAIEKLPSTIGHLVGLTLLDINQCRNLLDIPIEICNSKCLKKLWVRGSSKIEKLPGKMEFLEELDLGENAIREPLVGMKNLKRLWAFGSIVKPRDEWGLLRLFGIRNNDEPCWGLMLSSLNHMRCLVNLKLCYGGFGEGDIPHDIGSLSSLVSLDLSGNKFVTLPISIKCLSQLEYLCLKDCERLEQLPDLPSNSMLYVTVDGCTSLKRLSDPSKLSSRFANIYDFTFSSLNCITLVEDEDWMNTIYSRIVKFANKGICQYNYIVCPGKGIPEWFNNQSVGHSLNLELPPQSCSSWMGIAFCVVFAQRKGNPDALKYYGFKIQCLPEISFWISGEVHLVSEHLWIFYLSREECQEPFSFEEECQEPFSFETCYFVERPKVGLNMVKMCGARLVYKQDLEELNRTLTILKRTHGYCEEAAPSESGSFDDKEQAHKRQKEE